MLFCYSLNALDKQRFVDWCFLKIKCKVKTGLFRKKIVKWKCPTYVMFTQGKQILNS